MSEGVLQCVNQSVCHHLITNLKKKKKKRLPRWHYANIVCLSSVRGAEVEDDADPGQEFGIVDGGVCGEKQKY